MNQLSAPVALIVFNRPETTRRVFAAIAAARPERLLLIADGPRADRPGEAERCAEVREIVSKVDWPCRVDTNFATKNMGCAARVISGLNWVFSLVEEAVILEDDCLPDPSFFRFCSELLERYRDHCQVGYIGGSNVLQRSFPFSYSYFFSSISGIWGWATWRRAWSAFDEKLTTWPEVKREGLLDHALPNGEIVSFWSKIFDSMYAGTGPSAWDYQWLYTSWTNNWVSILPSRNLVQNIGFGPEATHTSNLDPFLAVPPFPLEFPLRHPPVIIPWSGQATLFQKLFYTPSILQRIRRRLRRTFHRSPGKQ
jgi:hypothetical protein